MINPSEINPDPVTVCLKTEPKTRSQKIRVVASKNSNFPWQLVGPKKFAPLGHKRLRRYFKTRTEALAERGLLINKIETVGAELAAMPPALLVDAQRAWGILGVIPGATLEEAARQFRAKHEILSKGITLEALVTLKLKLMRSNTRNPVLESTAVGVAGKLDSLLEAFPSTNVALIETAQVEEALDNLPSLAVMAQDKRLVRIKEATGKTPHRGRLPGTFTPKTISLYMAEWSSLFAFGVSKGYLTKNPMQGLKTPQIKTAKIGILTPAQMRSFLYWVHLCEPEMLAFYAIAAFAGVRRAELKRLDWSSIDLVARGIEVDATISKTASRRRIKISDNLAAWLQLVWKPSGPIIDPSVAKTDAKRRHRVCSHAGIINWPANGLRHSFGSYHLELHLNIFETMLEMGHTTREMLDKHYRALVAPTAAKEYFEIYPPGHALAKPPVTLISQAPTKPGVEPRYLIL